MAVCGTSDRRNRRAGKAESFIPPIAVLPDPLRLPRPHVPLTETAPVRFALPHRTVSCEDAREVLKAFAHAIDCGNRSSDGRERISSVLLGRLTSFTRARRLRHEDQVRAG